MVFNKSVTIPTKKADPASTTFDIFSLLFGNSAKLTPTVSAPTFQPARFNPYPSGGIGGAAPNLMNKLSGIVNTPNPSQAWGQNLANNSLANRFGTRPMRQNGVAGQLTPQPLPAGSTPTNHPAQQLQADYAIFEKGPATSGYLGAVSRLMKYFSRAG